MFSRLGLDLAAAVLLYLWRGWSKGGTWNAENLESYNGLASLASISNAKLVTW